ncbi:helix-turn-helix domain-containing protein [Shewanella psychropiezotolerans]|uniref:Helix-turn-helix domain-containing protein n=2 Tax=Shewanella psychropiezotolerans TaxID=2593655 RepID=A0ABX5WZW3_9GAMM|nr:helix-turn-helix domain-containing protein [Shewanella psychropiezotolerans]
MMKKVILVSHYQGIAPQALRNVPVHSPSIFAIKQGRKLMSWHEESLHIGGGDWLIAAAGSQLTFINEPHHQQFSSVQVSFLQPPSQELMDEIEVGYSKGNRKENKHRGNKGEARAVLSSAYHEFSQAQSPKLSANSQLCFALELLLSMQGQDLSTQVQSYYLNGFYQQLMEAGCLDKLFPGDPQSLRQRLSRYLAQSPGAEHHIEQVCKLFSMSKSTLTRHLALEGTSFREVLAEVRMLHGLSLMQKKNYRQVDLALLCGYQSESRFSQRFRQQFGVSPKHYMKTVRG